MSLEDHVVIFGGSFDPPHFGHFTVCSWLLTALNAAQVIVAPTFSHRFGKKLTAFEHRYNMCQDAFRELELFGELGLNYLDVLDIEKELPHPNTTINLVKAISKHEWYKYGKPAVAIGSDIAADLDKFEHWDEVEKLATIVVIGRSGYKFENNKKNYITYPIDLSAISSSEIRDRVKNNKNIKGLVHSRVERYINEKGLYR